jgi:metallo-beta-lactamase class B
MLLLTLSLAAPAPEVRAEKSRIELHRVSDTVWVHTTWKIAEGQQTPSNGLLIVTTEGLVLVDTPWGADQTQELLDLSQERFGMQVRLAVITHAHEDRIGGIGALMARYVATISTKTTARLAERQGYQTPEPRLDDRCTRLEVGGVLLEVYFPGEGHTADNMTVWLPSERVLFGGCLVKAASSVSVGNAEDANLGEWPQTLDRLLAKYPGAQVVIPGHGPRGGISLIGHTRDLLSRPVR